MVVKERWAWKWTSFALRVRGRRRFFVLWVRGNWRLYAQPGSERGMYSCTVPHLGRSHHHRTDRTGAPYRGYLEWKGLFLSYRSFLAMMVEPTRSARVRFLCSRQLKQKNLTHNEDKKHIISFGYKALGRIFPWSGLELPPYTFIYSEYFRKFSASRLVESQRAKSLVSSW